MEIGKQNFGVLVCIDVALIDIETMVLMESLDPQALWLVRSQKMFFLVPESKNKVAFLNSEIKFTYGTDTTQLNSLLIPFNIVYLDRINIQKVFAKIEFCDYPRKEYHYFSTKIRRAYIPYSENKVKDWEHHFKL